MIRSSHRIMHRHLTKARSSYTGYNKAYMPFVSTLMTTTTSLTTSNMSDRGMTRNKYSNMQSSSFHQTAKREILPIIAVGTLVVIGRYSYKALVRMDEEWEEYQEALREAGLPTDADHADTPSSSSSSPESSSFSSSKPNVNVSDMSNMFQGGSMGIDLGSYNLRISHLSKTKSDPAIVENREGARSTPALIVMDNDGEDDSILLGSMAKNKLYERTMYKNLPPIQFIQDQLSSSNEDENQTNNHNQSETNTQYLLHTIASSALEKVMGTKQHSSSSKTNPLFSIDESSGYNLRPVFTYNPSMSQVAKQRYQHLIQSLSSPSSISSFVQEPIAAVMGAKHYNLLKSSSNNGPIAVLDIGGHLLSLSLIDPSNSNKILYHITLTNLAGNALQTALVNLMKRDFFSSSSNNAPPDGMALQRLYDASEMAVMELSKNTRTQLNIPYLTVDTKTMQPKHLKMGISRNVLKNEMDEFISNEIKHLDNTASSSDSNYSIPVTNISSFMTHLFMTCMTQTNTNPFAIQNILLVGGGARSPIFQQAVKEGLMALGGDAYPDDKLIIPKGELVEDLVVLGAALAGSADAKMEHSHLISQDWSR